jgi:hypothetical protein
MPKSTPVSTATKQQNDAVNGNDCLARDGELRHKRHDRRYAPISEKDSNDAAADRQHYRFSQQLADDAAAAGAQRTPQGNLFLAGAGPGEQ